MQVVGKAGWLQVGVSENANLWLIGVSSIAFD